MRNLFIALIFFIYCLALGSQDYYSEGLDAYWDNNMVLASEKFEMALQQEPRRDELHMFLGSIYHNRGQYEQAESIMSQGRQFQGEYYNIITFNLVNLLVELDRFSEAEGMLSEIYSDQWASRVHLIRANCRMELENYTGAVEDYQRFIQLEPQDSQRENIEQIIALLQEKFDREEELARQAEERARLEEEARLAAEREAAERARLEEEARLAAEREAAERARLEEEARLAAEREAAEEAARQQALLDEILASLDAAGTDSEVISAGNESIETDSEESDIME